MLPSPLAQPRQPQWQHSTILPAGKSAFGTYAHKTNESTYSADTRRALNVLSLLSASHAAQFLVSLLLPHGDQVLVRNLPFNAEVVHVL